MDHGDPHLVLEVQRDKDPDKEYSWPVYVTVVRAKKRCPTVVLVVAPDAEVATWAAQPIDLGLGFGTLRPVVLGPASVPEVTDLQIYAGAAAPVNFNGLVRHYDLRAASNAADIQVTAQGWFFVRAVAMVFDRYIQSDRTRAQFSKII